MNKKGFSLVELIAVITILGLLITLVTPKLMGNYNDKRNKLYNATIEETERVAGLYLTDNPELYSDISDNGYIDIAIDTLCDKKYITCPITNPINNGDIEGYVRVSYENNKYIYRFSNNNYLNEKVLVTLELNGGSTSQKFNNKYIVGSNIVFENPMREGYTFTGWTSTSGIVSGSTFTMGSSDATLIANWEGNTYAVTLDANGGIFDFVTYTEAKEYEYIIPEEGKYKLEVWGAQGVYMMKQLMEVMEDTQQGRFT